MKKYIQCMKSNNKNNIKLYTLLFLLFYIVVDFCNYNSNDFLKYIIIMVILLILVWDNRFNYKIEDISVTSEELLNDYNNNIYESDKKYNRKYVKLTGVVSELKIINKKNVYILLKSNSEFIIIANSASITNKCLKYIENISKGDNITIYGDLFRNNNELRLFMWYISNN
ncbi:MAG: hypothetical protein RR623_08205 [Bacilli bacterium]